MKSRNRGGADSSGWDRDNVLADDGIAARRIERAADSISRRLREDLHAHMHPEAVRFSGQARINLIVGILAPVIAGHLKMRPPALHAIIGCIGRDGCRGRAIGKI